MSNSSLLGIHLPLMPAMPQACSFGIFTFMDEFKVYKWICIYKAEKRCTNKLSWNVEKNDGLKTGFNYMSNRKLLMVKARRFSWRKRRSTLDLFKEHMQEMLYWTAVSTLAVSLAIISQHHRKEEKRSPLCWWKMRNSWDYTVTQPEQKFACLHAS